MKNKIFTVSNSLSSPFNVNSSNICHLCQKSFSYTSSLIKHMRIHTKEKPYTCRNGCNQKFSQISNLIRHERIHSGDKPYLCKYCSKSFASSSNLKQHLNIHLNLIIRKKYICFINDCDKGYLYICTLKKHIKKYHPIEYNSITDYYNDENFILIYKNLHDDKSLFKFVNFKQLDYNEKGSFKSSKRKDSEEERINKFNDNGKENINYLYNNNIIDNSTHVNCTVNPNRIELVDNNPNIDGNNHLSPFFLDSFITYMNKDSNINKESLNKDLFDRNNTQKFESYLQNKRISNEILNYFSLYHFYQKMKEFQLIQSESCSYGDLMKSFNRIKEDIPINIDYLRDISNSFTVLNQTNTIKSENCLNLFKEPNYENNALEQGKNNEKIKGKILNQHPNSSEKRCNLREIIAKNNKESQMTRKSWESIPELKLPKHIIDQSDNTYSKELNINFKADMIESVLNVPYNSSKNNSEEKLFEKIPKFEDFSI